MPLRAGIGAALDLSHTPPENIRGISILFVAGHNAAFAADTLRHVEVESVLLAGFRQSELDTDVTHAAEGVAPDRVWLLRAQNDEAIRLLGSVEQR